MGIKFFRKNVIDFANSLIEITVTDAIADDDGQDFVDLIRNRDNNSGWGTTNSLDAANTTLEIQFGETRTIERAILIGHTFKSYTLKYWNGSAWTNFSTTIAPTTNEDSDTYHEFTEVQTTAVQLVILGTIDANTDKFLTQLILCEELGEFEDEPEVQPQFDKDRKATKFLSGKTFVARSVGGFNCRIRKKSVSNENDLSIVETLFNSYEGFLVWLCGGTVSQFETVRAGYRMRDIFLMNLSNEMQPEWLESRYYNGMQIDLRLVEVNV